MKKILFISVLLLVSLTLLGGCSGNPLTEEQKTISVVKTADGMGQDKLYEVVKIWMAQNFNSSKAMIEYDNKEAGTIIGNSNMRFPCSGLGCLGQEGWKLHFSMRVDVKEERYKVSYRNIEVSWPASYISGVRQPAYRGPISQKAYDNVKAALLELADRLEASINSGEVTESEDEDW